MSQANEQLEHDELNLDDIADSLVDGEEEVEEEDIDDTDANLDEGNEGEGEEESEEEDTKPDDDDPEFEIEHGGKKLKLKKSELVAGYMMEADYRRKTAELGEQRRKAEELMQAVTQERQQYVNQLTTALQVIQSELQEDQEALNELAQSNPAEYIARLQKANAKAQKYQQIEQARQALLKQQQEAEAKAQAEFAKRERQVLLEKLPSWRDEKRAVAEQKVIANYLLDIGYTADELNELIDHRALLVARDAALYRASKQAKQKQHKPHRAPIKPGAATRTTAKEAAAAKAVERLKRNPDSLDALASFAAARGV